MNGSDASDVVVTFAGTGSLGNQPLLMVGSSIWYFDGAAQDYLEMDFDQGTKIGANSLHQRVKGKEKIICMLNGKVVGGDGLVCRIASDESHEWIRILVVCVVVG